MSDRNQYRKIENVVSRVMKTVARYDTIGTTKFETILHKIMQQVEKNTKADPDMIAELTPRVIADMPGEYGQLSESERSWEAMIAYLYAKYLRELGLLK